MSTDKPKYPPTHRWADDGPVFEGEVTGLRWVKGKPEYGGGMIPVMQVSGADGPKALFLSGAVLNAVKGAAPRYGDVIRIERSTEAKPFKTPEGESRSFYPVDVDVRRKQGSPVDLEVADLPPARDADEDIPF